MSKRLYVASSWRNPYQPQVVQIARAMGFSVYDFREPVPGQHGFSWRDITPEPVKEWSFERYREVLAHPIAEGAFQADMAGLQADATLLVMPAGRSAHWEHGYAVGRGQQVATLYPVDIEMPNTFGDHAPTSSVCMECHPEYADHGGIPKLDRYVCELRHKLRRDFEPELMVKGGSGGILIGRREMEVWLQFVLDTPVGTGKWRDSESATPEKVIKHRYEIGDLVFGIHSGRKGKVTMVTPAGVLIQWDGHPSHDPICYHPDLHVKPASAKEVP